jgi:uncharacterized SAM-binding protein YcdF (DUF218 family)
LSFSGEAARRAAQQISGNPVSRRLLRLFSTPLATRTARVEPADAIVVLGCPVFGGRISPPAEQRVEAGMELLRRGGAPLLCFSGGGGEAAVMAARAFELGVPLSALRVEPNARSTEENAILSAALLRADGCEDVWVVTHGFHLRRALYWFRRNYARARGWQPESGLEIEKTGPALKMLLREYLAWAALAARSAARRRPLSG